MNSKRLQTNGNDDYYVVKQHGVLPGEKERWREGKGERKRGGSKERVKGGRKERREV